MSKVGANQGAMNKDRVRRRTERWTTEGGGQKRGRDRGTRNRSRETKVEKDDER